ncbi:MAG: helix-turn-helix domain-containing protein [Leptospiraceae bacterium]|nr:helix-turn-helix domain-containing protein [Leptospiraceae bacterium]
MEKNQYNELFSYLGLSQRAFAKEFEIPQSTLSETVNGRIKSLPVEIIYRLNKEHGISLDWLVRGEGEMFDVGSKDSLTKEETELFQEVRKNPKLVGFLKGVIENFKKAL